MCCCWIEELNINQVKVMLNSSNTISIISHIVDPLKISDNLRIHNIPKTYNYTKPLTLHQSCNV